MLRSPARCRAVMHERTIGSCGGAAGSGDGGSATHPTDANGEVFLMGNSGKPPHRRVCLPLDIAERLLANTRDIHQLAREIMDGVGSSSNKAYEVAWTSRACHATLERYVERAQRRAAEDSPSS